MDDIAGMRKQAEEKLASGFRCLKFKVGSNDFNSEIRILSEIRENYGDDIIIRLDANGAFNDQNVFDCLKEYSAFNIHSIEQPVRVGNIDLLKKVCSESPVPVALDEELISVTEGEMSELLESVCPQFIVLKPSLLGGLEKCNRWIEIAESMKIGWWATSYLESNIGLNAIAQWVSEKKLSIHQGLGTGGIFKKNIPSPLEIRGEMLSFNPEKKWDLKNILDDEFGTDN